MKLQEVISLRNHYFYHLTGSDSIMVYLTGEETENYCYWQLEDYVVSSRIGNQIVLIPKK
jgi:hypothetical protein